MEIGEKKAEVTETLHIPALRKKWQILVLQIVSTASLLLLLKWMSELYGPCSEQFIIDNREPVIENSAKRNFVSKVCIPKLSVMKWEGRESS